MVAYELLSGAGVPVSPANDGYKPGFTAALMLKDLKLAQEAAASVGAATPLGAAAVQLYALYVASGERSTTADNISGLLGKAGSLCHYWTDMAPRGCNAVGRIES
jgi:NAD-binding of NADP-dependent 3-hydroxyisobutyrate dehydrogenase